jgi:hypothetical protein
VKLLRRILIGVTAFVLPAGLVTAICAQGAYAHPPTGNGTGTLSCSNITGVLHFSPPLNFSGGSPDLVKVRLRLTGCNASGGNIINPNFSGKGSGELSTSSNNCTSFEGAQSVSGSIEISWTAKTRNIRGRVYDSLLEFTSITGIASGANGNAALTFSRQSSGSGQGVSFTGSMSGELDSNTPASTFAGPKRCGATHRLRTAKIVAGHLSQP